MNYSFTLFKIYSQSLFINILIFLVPFLRLRSAAIINNILKNCAHTYDKKTEEGCIHNSRCFSNCTLVSRQDASVIKAGLACVAKRLVVP